MKSTNLLLMCQSLSLRLFYLIQPFFFLLFNFFLLLNFLFLLLLSLQIFNLLLCKFFIKLSQILFLSLSFLFLFQLFLKLLFSPFPLLLLQYQLSLSLLFFLDHRIFNKLYLFSNRCNKRPQIFILISSTSYHHLTATLWSFLRYWCYNCPLYLIVRFAALFFSISHMIFNSLSVIFDSLLMQHFKPEDLSSFLFPLFSNLLLSFSFGLIFILSSLFLSFLFFLSKVNMFEAFLTLLNDRLLVHLLYLELKAQLSFTFNGFFLTLFQFFLPLLKKMIMCFLLKLRLQKGEGTFQTVLCKRNLYYFFWRIRG